MMNEEERQFAKALSAYNLPITPRAFSLLCQYYALLAEANQHMNLTAVIAPEEAALRHFVDALRPEVRAQLLPGQTIADIGTGAGFPGLPLAVVHTECRFILVDSQEKRTHFLEEVIEKMGLTNCAVVRARAESFGRSEWREKLDHVLSRAVAHMCVLHEYMLPCLRIGGTSWSWKGPSAPEEVQGAHYSASLLGGGQMECLPYALGNVTFFVVKTQKVKHTSLKFPRKDGIPAKQPIQQDQ